MIASFRNPVVSGNCSILRISVPAMQAAVPSTSPAAAPPVTIPASAPVAGDDRARLRLQLLQDHIGPGRLAHRVQPLRQDQRPAEPRVRAARINDRPQAEPVVDGGHWSISY